MFFSVSARDVIATLNLFLVPTVSNHIPYPISKYSIPSHSLHISVAFCSSIYPSLIHGLDFLLVKIFYKIGLSVTLSRMGQDNLSSGSPSLSLWQANADCNKAAGSRHLLSATPAQFWFFN